MFGTTHPHPYPNLTPHPHPLHQRFLKARKLVGTRGETALVERAVTRLPGPMSGQAPPKKFEPGRQRLRHARALARLRVELTYAPCKKGNDCNHDCTYVTPGDRTLLHKEYISIRTEVRTLNPSHYFSLPRTQALSLIVTLTPLKDEKRC